MGVFPRKDSPFWWYRIEGTKVQKSTEVPRVGGSPKQTAELRRQAETIYADAAGKHALAHAGLVPTPKPTISFQDFARWYQTHVIVHHRGADKAASMLRTLGKHFDRFTDLRAVTTPVVREWMTLRKTQVAPSTVNRELDVLTALLRAAVPTYLEVYPLGDVRHFRQIEREARVLTFEEEQRLLAVCGPSDRAFVLAGLDTLLRLGSLIALKWEQVKLEDRAIVALNAKVKTRPKPISSRLYQALQALPRPSVYVFGQFYRGTGATAAKNLATRRFALLCQLANVPLGRAVNGVTIHCLRHTGATRALQAGHSVRTVMELGGWTLPATVMRYLHVSDADVVSAAESISQQRSHSVARKGTRRA